MADLVIRGGTVVDGTGAPGVRADVAIAGDRIAAIGPRLSGARTLDASGCVVAPGFVDIHTHYDAQVFWDPALTPSCFHGVTTVVAGNCGFSIAPTRPAHRDVIARRWEAGNGPLRGAGFHGQDAPRCLTSIGRRGTRSTGVRGAHRVRLYVMGEAAYERKASDEEVARMCAVVRKVDGGRRGGSRQLRAPRHRRQAVPSRFAELPSSRRWRACSPTSAAVWWP
jgi:N-acyl-D-aspartate/D-glutamate deacylase